MAIQELPQLASETSWRKQDWAYDRLREWVLDGTLEPGRALDQQSIATALGISRVPVRHALARLAATGLVIDRPHQQWVVAPISLEDARDVYTGREVLESALAAEATAHWNAAATARSKKLIADQRAVIASGDSQEYVALDREFHIHIYEQANLPRSLSVLDQLFNVSDRYIYLYAADMSRGENAIAEHSAIISALESGDSDRAAEITKYHIRHGYNVLSELL